MVENRSTLCWKCQNTNADKCSWFNKDNPNPVEGWTAIRKDIMVSTTYQGKYAYRREISYCVLDCPNFEPIKKNKKQSSIRVTIRKKKQSSYDLSCCRHCHNRAMCERDKLTCSARAKEQSI